MDAFLVFETDDRLNASLCMGEEQTRETVAIFKDQRTVRVHRVTLDELVRNVTDDFVREPVDELAGTAWDRAASAADTAHQMAREAAA